jgi:hypothetical protein
VNHDKAADDKALAYFNSIDSSINIDPIGHKNSKHSHVNVVQRTNIKHMNARPGSEHFWHNHRCKALISYQQWERRYGGHNHLMPPSQVNHVVNKAK